MTDYVRPDGLVARTDLSTPCRCGREGTCRACKNTDAWKEAT